MGTDRRRWSSSTRPSSPSSSAGPRRTSSKTSLPNSFRRSLTPFVDEAFLSLGNCFEDAYCDLSPLQAELYAAFTERLSQSQPGEKRTSMFAALAYLRKLVDHPCLVLPNGDPRALRTLEASGKLSRLGELLTECGMGGGREAGEAALLAPHRALVFCQFRPTLSLIEELLRSGQLGGGPPSRSILSTESQQTRLQGP